MAYMSSWVWSASDLPILIAVFTCTWVFVHGIYNSFFHSLCRYPGPLFGGISHWPSAYHAWKGDRHLWLEKCFRKYGNKIRVEPNTIVFRSPNAYRDIYSSKANVTRARFYNALKRDEDNNNTLVVTDKALHAKKRRLLNLVFTEKSLSAATGFMEKHIDRWHEILSEECRTDWSKPLNFTPWADRLVFDILGDIVFGRSFEIKEPGDNPIKEVPHAIAELMKFVYLVVKSPLVGAFIYLRPRGLTRLLDALRSRPLITYDDFIQSSVKSRVAEIRDRKAAMSAIREDMFHFLCTAEDPDTGLFAFDEGDIKGEAQLLLIAGSDSTSVTMCGLFFYLAHYPTVLRKLATEVRETFTTADEITRGSKLQSCFYLRACIDEGMRMAPAGLSELPREVLPGGIKIDGEFFPAGTIVGTANWTDNRNEEVFGDPEMFRPERWIPDERTSAEEVSRTRAAFHPFSVGSFNCAGSSFALQELMLMVARTVHRFDVRPPPGNVVEGGIPHFPLIDAYVTLRDGPMLQFKRRE